DPAALAATVAAEADRRGLGSGPPTRLRYVVGTAMSFLARRRADAPVSQALDRQRSIEASRNGRLFEREALPQLEHAPAIEEAEPVLPLVADERRLAIDVEEPAAAMMLAAEDDIAANDAL